MAQESSELDVAFAEEVETVLDRAIEALERIHTEELEALANDCDQVFVACTVVSIPMESALRLRNKHALLGKLLTQTRLNSQLLQRLCIAQTCAIG